MLVVVVLFNTDEGFVEVVVVVVVLRVELDNGALLVVVVELSSPLKK